MGLVGGSGVHPIGYTLVRELTGDRDYWMAVPNHDLSGCVDRPAGYVEMSACSRALYRDMERPVHLNLRAGEAEATPRWEWVFRGENLFAKELWFYYTEHSDRNWLISAATALRAITKEEGSMLGRWGSDSSEEYIRTSRLTCERVQREVARRIRLGEGLTDILDESSEFEKITRSMRAAGATTAVIDEQIARLRYFGWWDNAVLEIGDAGAPPQEPGPPPLGWVDLGGKPAPVVNGGEVDAVEQPMEVVAEAADVDVNGGEVDAGEVEPVVVAEAADVEAPEEPVAKAAEPAAGDERERTVGYVVVYTHGRKTRRLHHTSGCWRVPGQDYHDYDELGGDVPDPTAYNCVCKQCWGSRGSAPVREVPASPEDVPGEPEEAAGPSDEEAACPDSGRGTEVESSSSDV